MKTIRVFIILKILIIIFFINSILISASKEITQDQFNAEATSYHFGLLPQELQTADNFKKLQPEERRKYISNNYRDDLTLAHLQLSGFNGDEDKLIAQFFFSLQSKNINDNKNLFENFLRSEGITFYMDSKASIKDYHNFILKSSTQSIDIFSFKDRYDFFLDGGGKLHLIEKVPTINKQQQFSLSFSGELRQENGKLVLSDGSISFDGREEIILKEGTFAYYRYGKATLKDGSTIDVIFENGKYYQESSNIEVTDVDSYQTTHYSIRGEAKQVSGVTFNKITSFDYEIESKRMMVLSPATIDSINNAAVAVYGSEVTLPEGNVLKAGSVQYGNCKPNCEPLQVGKASIVEFQKFLITTQHELNLNNKEGNYMAINNNILELGGEGFNVEPIKKNEIVSLDILSSRDEIVGNRKLKFTMEGGILRIAFRIDAPRGDYKYQQMMDIDAEGSFQITNSNYEISSDSKRLFFREIESIGNPDDEKSDDGREIFTRTNMRYKDDYGIVKNYGITLNPQPLYTDRDAQEYIDLIMEMKTLDNAQSKTEVNEERSVLIRNKLHELINIGKENAMIISEEDRLNWLILTPLSIDIDKYATTKLQIQELEARIVELSKSLTDSPNEQHDEIRILESKKEYLSQYLKQKDEADSTERAVDYIKEYERERLIWINGLREEVELRRKELGEDIPRLSNLENMNDKFLEVNIERDIDDAYNWLRDNPENTEKDKKSRKYFEGIINDPDKFKVQRYKDTFEYTKKRIDENKKFISENEVLLRYA